MKVNRDNRVVILVICLILICTVASLGFKTHGESFLEEKTVLIEVLAADISDMSPEDMTRRFIPFYHKSSGFSSIGFVNSTGVIVTGYPVENTAIGLDLYATNKSGSFERAKASGETYITNPVLLVQGGIGSTIGVPVYSGDEFRGVVFAIIKISTITDRFLEPIMQDRTGYVYMIDHRGKSLYDGARREAIGENYIKMLGENQSGWRDIIEKQMNGSEGTAVYLKEGDESKSEQIVAYAPVRWRNKIWSVAISVPASEVDNLIRSVYARQMIFLGTVIAIILGGSLGLIVMFSQWNKTLEAEVKSKTSDMIRMNKELVLANERLKELDKLKSDFVSMVSHELKTPLAAMRTSAQVLEVADIATETKREMLDIILRNIDRQTNLVNDLLDLSRIESGRMELKIESVLLGSVIADSIESVKQAASEEGIKLDVELPEGLSSVKGDREKLTQVVINLLNNAIKFTPRSGEISIKARELNGQVEVKVSDTGIGIPPEDLDSVFDKFYQVDSTLTREAGGTGLGLAICKGIIEAHRGRIWAESELDKGSTFIFRLEKWVSDKTS
jgi:signal transduction histidine kinase